MADEGFREIQLNGKQLVFLFMTGTVAAVVIFLCGVMVGRGIQSPRASQAIEATADTPGADPTAAAQPAVPPPTTPTDGASAASQETLTYPDRLEDPTPPPETLRDADATPAPAPAAKAPEPPAEKPAPARAKAEPPARVEAPAKTTEPASAASAEPAGNGFVVQVAAVRDRSEADAIAKRLAAKGYPTFVTTPGNGAPRVFRVRVGKYPDRREADTVAGRLQKEEQFKPWITR